MRVAQLSDTHLLPVGGKLHGVDTFESLVTALEQAMSLGPDVILITGDLAEDGSESTYCRAKELFAKFQVPFFLSPGNHDDAAVMRSIFTGSNARLETSTILGDWVVAFVDSQVPGRSHGFIPPEAIIEVESAASSGRPCLIALHHPILSDCPSSGCQITNGKAFSEVLIKHSSIKVVLSGHLHQSFARELGHVQLLGAPSTFANCTHLKEPTANTEDFWASHCLDASSRGFRFLELSSSGSIETTVHLF
jgi:3',5'-cyclic-AMP phosphodiesterase